LNRCLFIWLCVLGFILNGGSVQAQTTYKMSNAKVYSCKGKLTDSEGNKQAPKKYANNENYTFTVCVVGSSTINVKFNGPLCIENISDYLKVYKGTDTNGVLLRTYTGTINTPLSINASDTCITFFFHSDANIVCDGWDLNWEAKITSVPQPKFSAIADPDCNSNKIRVTLDQWFNCDSVKAKNFVLSGALSTAVTNVVPVNCNSKNETKTFDVYFASGLNKSGNYLLNFNSSFKDACDSIWKINAKLNFKISNCPILVDLKSNRYTLCKGSCAQLTATITGGNISNYTYTWLSGGLTGAPPKWVCPTVNTQYILKVSDGVSVPGYDTIDIVVLDPPTAQNDTTVCQSSAPFNLTASPSGGVWSGTGITNAANGTFSPSVAGGGTFKIYYTIGTCRDSVMITVRPIWAGNPNAACPNAPKFMVTGFTPTGGKWSGPNIDSFGVVTPTSSPSTFVVTYTWNGCSSNKTINIDGINIKQFDTVCKSVTLDTFKFTPKGGVWTGPSVTNASLGINNPNAAGAGTKNYIYTINGCRDTLQRYISDVDARWDEIVCPDAGNKVLPLGLPSGGYWTGKGIIDSLAGVFSPDSFKVPSQSTFTQTNLTYHALNGCKDVKIIYLRYSRFYTDTVKNCVSDTAYFMRYQYIKNDPWNLLFTGSKGIVGTSVYSQKFSPALAGRGSINTIIGDGNGCKDTLIILVHPRAAIQKDTSVCIADDPFKLFNGTGKGTFSGKGISNAITGLFSPLLAGVGTHIILFNYPGKCQDTVRVTVRPLPTVNVLGLLANYCMRDSNTQLVLMPGGGTLSGAGITDSSFNPYKAGTGSHTITYKVGSGKCVNSKQYAVQVADTLKFSISSDKDTICPGVPVTLSSQIKGGTGNYQWQWSNGASNVQNIYVLPKATTQYWAIVKDGCSDSVMRALSVYVHPKFFGQITTSPIQCYGNLGFAEIKMTGTGPYSYTWNTIPQQFTPKIAAGVGTTYKVYVKNDLTQCTYDTTANIPGYSRIRAYFATSPAGQCLYSNNALLRIIDLSEGGRSGFWDFGDNVQVPYTQGVNPSHQYAGDTDSYTVTLWIKNEGNCVDSFSVRICVLDTITLFIPNAFTPNDDGSNDVFKINSGSVSKANIQIYNRWGERLFETDDYKQGWDGTYQGQACATDYYVYLIKYKGKKTPWRYKKGYFYLLR